MRLANKKIHRVLLYIDGVTRNGATVDKKQVDEFGEAAKPKPAQYENIMTGFRESVLRSTGQRKVSDAETVTAYLKRLGWASEKNGAIKLTQLGRAALSELNSRKTIDTTTDPLTVIIDPTDQLAYLKILDGINEQGEGMLVDPYLDMERLVDLATMSTVDRILTSDRNSRGNRLTYLGRALSQVERNLELRTVDQALLHDRFFIGTNTVFHLGSSLNSIDSRPGVITPMKDPAAISALRSAYESLWSDGDKLEPVPDPEKQIGTGDTPK